MAVITLVPLIMVYTRDMELSKSMEARLIRGNSIMERSKAQELVFFPMAMFMLDHSKGGSFINMESSLILMDLSSKGSSIRVNATEREQLSERMDVSVLLIGTMAKRLMIRVVLVRLELTYICFA